MSKEEKVRVRIAPSPTGYPHIGTIYQALFNYAFAHHYKGQFLVRIEDTDRARLVEDAEDAIFNALDWFGLTEDESPRKKGEFGPYRQSERLDLYHEYAQQLIDAGGAEFAYYPKEDAGKKEHDYKNSPRVSIQNAKTASPGSVKEMIENKDKFGDWVVRLVVPKDKTIVVEDGIRGIVEFDSNGVTNQVLLKSDGFPTYHLAVVVDDHLMQITHVLRGEEWLSSAPKHVLIYDYFGWKKPQFFHTAVLRNPDKSKLSKRQGHTNVSWYKEEGFLQEAILNFLALLSWSHPEEKEIFSLGEFISLFDFKDIKPVGPVFDITKLEWMNGVYIREMDTDMLMQRLIAFDDSLQALDTELFKKLIELTKTRMKTLKEFKEQVMPFFERQKLEFSDQEKEMRQKLSDRLQSIQNWSNENIVEILKAFTKENGVNFKSLYKITIKKEFGLPLGNIFEIIGKEKTLSLLS